MSSLLLVLKKLKLKVAIDCQGDFNVSVASDFIAQYTLRQEYRHERVPPDRGDEAENNPWPRECPQPFYVYLLIFIRSYIAKICLSVEQPVEQRCECRGCAIGTN